jgi:drug/metabolite transporter (DMT)-like permease
MPARTLKRTPAGQQLLGLGASVLAAIGWGFGGVFAKLASMSGLVLTFYRLWLGAALLLLVARATRRHLSFAVFRASLLGGVVLACDMAMFFSAIKLTSVADATVISAVQPVIVLIAARSLFGERMGRWDVALILVAVAGVSTAVVGPGVPNHHVLTGDLLAVGALLAWSVYWLATKSVRARTGIGAIEYTAGVTTVAAVVLTPVVLLSGEPVARVVGGDWLWICLLTIVPGGAHVLMNWAHRYVDASVSSVVGSSNPVVAAIGAYLILGQPLTAVQIAGGLVGIGAITAVAGRHRHPADSPVSSGVEQVDEVVPGDRRAGQVAAGDSDAAGMRRAELGACPAGQVESAGVPPVAAD